MFSNNVLGGAYYGDKIKEIILTSSSAQIDFDIIDQSFTGLFLSGMGKTDKPTSDHAIVGLQFNDDSGNNYYFNNIVGRSTGVTYTQSNGSSLINVGEFPTDIGDADLPGSFSCIIYNYNNDIFDKQLISQSFNASRRSISTASRLSLRSGNWNNTSPIIKISIKIITGNNFLIGSRFSLYGIQ